MTFSVADDRIVRLAFVAAVSIAAAAVFATLSLKAPEYFFRTQPAALQGGAETLYYIRDGRGVPGYDPSDPELARLALDAWSRESGGKLKFTPARSESEALLRLHWISANQGRFGEMQRIDVDGKPGAIVFVSPATDGLSAALADMASRDRLLRDAIVYLTCVHEIGHAVGLPHTRDFEDIMYSFGYGGDITAYFMRYRKRLKSRDDIRLFSGLSPNDVTALRMLFLN